MELVSIVLSIGQILWEGIARRLSERRRRRLEQERQRLEQERLRLEQERRGRAADVQKVRELLNGTLSSEYSQHLHYCVMPQHEGDRVWLHSGECSDDFATLEKYGFSTAGIRVGFDEKQFATFTYRECDACLGWLDREFPGVPECFKQLGILKCSCTRKEVKAAYRRAVRIAHPDAGGTHDLFISLRNNYEKALTIATEDQDEDTDDDLDES